MIVLAESNFVLELAFEQEEALDALRIVELAEDREIELVIPACALTEPYETLIRRRKERNTTLERVRNEINQLARSRSFADLAQTSRAVTEALARSGTSEAAGLQDSIRRLLTCATIPELSRTTVAGGLSAQAQYALEPQDAIVFASVEEASQGPTRSGRKGFHQQESQGFSKTGHRSPFRSLQLQTLP